MIALFKTRTKEDKDESQIGKQVGSYRLILLSLNLLRSLCFILLNLILIGIESPRMHFLRVRRTALLGLVLFVAVLTLHGYSTTSDGVTAAVLPPFPASPRLRWMGLPVLSHKQQRLTVPLFSKPPHRFPVVNCHWRCQTPWSPLLRSLLTLKMLLHFRQWWSAAVAASPVAESLSLGRSAIQQPMSFTGDAALAVYGLSFPDGSDPAQRYRQH